MKLYEEILDADDRIGPHVERTPLTKALLLSKRIGANVFLKCEHLQKTGSFKFRGALNKVLLLTDEEKRRGVIAASTGNHGQGVALASQITGTEATIYVPEDSSPIKLTKIEALGANVKTCAGDCLQAEVLARQEATAQEKIFISPYNDPFVIAGQGTIGVELYKQCPTLDAVFVSVGGGGLISGIASYFKKVNPKIRIIGCWPENAPAMYKCIKAGRIIDVPEKATLSDGTAGGVEEGSITFNYCRDLIDDCVLVSEVEIASAMRLIANEESWIIEGAAGVAVAAFLKQVKNLQGKNVAIILCGRNINFNKFLGAVQ